MSARRYPVWECFPPYGDRAYHGYLPDAEEGVAVSLCGRRTVPLSEHDPRARHVRVRGKKADQPDLADTTGYCAACVDTADGRGMLPFNGKWESESVRKRRRRVARERRRRTL